MKGARAGVERRLRRAWTGRPGPVLRAAGALYGLVADGRHLLYEVGVLQARVPPVPVISVGGLTVGGSGKTPLSAEVARWLLAAGRRPAVVTRGYADELRVHRRLLPGVPVLGHPDRRRAVREVARRGARCAVLDDGFAHRSLARALDLLLIDADALRGTNRRRLPAGPFRHPLGALTLADALVVTHRGPEADMAGRAARRLARRSDGRPVGVCTLRPGPVIAVNEAARRTTPPDPAVAVVGIMKPRLFFEAARRSWPRLDALHTFRDHRGPGRRRLEAICRSAGDRGIVCTLKDAVRLGPRVGEATPVWYVPDVIEWGRGESTIRELVLERTAEPRAR